MNKTRRIQAYDREGKPKPGGLLIPNQSRLVVGVEICQKCHKLKGYCKCR